MFGRKRANSESHPNPYQNLLDPNNAYVPMNHFNSPRFVGLPLSPGPPVPFAQHPAFSGAPGYASAAPQATLAAGFNAFPWMHYSPNMYPVDLPALASNAISVHVLLAPKPGPFQAQPSVLYDVRLTPDCCWVKAHPRPIKLPDEYADSFATQPPVGKMRLVCRDLPWRITVSNAKGVTIGDVVEAVYKELQQPLTEGEWWIAQEEDRDRAMEAYQTNCVEELSDGQKRKLEDGVKRVDWLGKKTMLQGISRSPLDETFIKARIPDKKSHPETWIVEFGEPSSIM